MSDEQPQFIVMLVTAGSEAEGQKIASKLVESHLAACVNMFPVGSTYRWQGAVQCDREWQLVIKTQRHLYPAVESLILS
ncbi:MAG: divalent-cation tolerance protein CutA, partial [Cyanobacteria bacterium P01_F01_bin.42]